MAKEFEVWEFMLSVQGFRVQGLGIFGGFGGGPKTAEVWEVRG